jgi:hypothetical protein
LTRPPAARTATIAGRTVTAPVSARPATTWRGLIGVILSCRSQPVDRSSATPPPVFRAEPIAPYAAMPIMEAVFQSLSAPPPRLVNSRYITTGITTPPIMKPTSRSVRRTSSRR